MTQLSYPLPKIYTKPLPSGRFSILKIRYRCSIVEFFFLKPWADRLIYLHPLSQLLLSATMRNSQYLKVLPCNLGTLLIFLFFTFLFSFLFLFFFVNFLYCLKVLLLCMGWKGWGTDCLCQGACTSPLNLELCLCSRGPDHLK